MSKDILLEKYVKVAVKKALKEEEARQQKAEKALYLVYRFPGLKKVMEDLMSPAFGRYVNNIDIFSAKPTTFKVSLINGQDFNVKYLGKNKFNLKIAGKQYNPINLGELERASQAVADILELNYAPSEGKEQTPLGTSGEELGPDLAAANAEPTPPAATPTPPAETAPGTEEELPPPEA